LENLLHRVRSGVSADAETNPRTAQARTHFWEEFRAGQREADERMVAAADRPQPVTR
jgi:hypothetical protein